MINNGSINTKVNNDKGNRNYEHNYYYWDKPLISNTINITILTQYNQNDSYEGAQCNSANGNREKKMAGKTEIIQKPTAAGNGKWSTTNRKFVNYNLSGNGYCLILSKISLDWSNLW